MNPLLHLLLASTRICFAPENDAGYELDGDDGHEEGTDVGGADEGDDDALDQEPGDDGASDRGEDDDDGADAGQTDASAEDQVRKPNRAQARVETALREAREAKEEARRAREELQASRTQETTQAAQAQRQARLEQMDPYERQTFLMEERAREQDARLARIEFNSVDAADKSDFASKCARNPALAAVADDVEAELKRVRANGNNVDRETVAAYVLGKRALERGARAKSTQGKKGAANIASQRGRATGGRSDIQPGASAKGDTAQARRKRLEDVQL